MTATRSQSHISEEEYLAFERASDLKHEYYRGRVYAMTGAKEPHNLIVANCIATLHAQLRRKPCRVYPADMRVKVLQTGLNTYPDITVVCGSPQFTDDVRDTIVNPLLIVEVLSASTERYDRGLKFQNYRTIETLQDYLLIAQDHYIIEHFSRQENGLWLLHEATSMEMSIEIQSIESVLRLEDVYEKVELAPESDGIPGEASPQG